MLPHSGSGSRTGMNQTDCMSQSMMSQCRIPPPPTALPLASNMTTMSSMYYPVHLPTQRYTHGKIGWLSISTFSVVNRCVIYVYPDRMTRVW